MGFYTKKLIRRLIQKGVVFAPNVTIRCLRPGPAGRSAGAFNWVFEPVPDGGGVRAGGELGSEHTVRECAQADILTLRITHWGDVFIDAENRAPK